MANAAGFIAHLMTTFPVQLGSLLLLLLSAAHAADVQVVALTNGKATLVIDGARPRTLVAGERSPEGVRLISASARAAVVEIAGKRHDLQLGSSYRIATADVDAHTSSGRISIPADGRGHFIVNGLINNGAAVRFLVDTGASMVSISAQDATRAGINYLAGQCAYSQTASGVVTVYRVKLDTLKIGDITLYNVDAAVHPSGQLPIALLGMSFLSRMDLRNEGAMLTLIRRY